MNVHCAIHHWNGSGPCPDCYPGLFAAAEAPAVAAPAVKHLALTAEMLAAAERAASATYFNEACTAGDAISWRNLTSKHFARYVFDALPVEAIPAPPEPKPVAWEVVAVDRHGRCCAHWSFVGDLAEEDAEAFAEKWRSKYPTEKVYINPLFYASAPPRTLDIDHAELKARLDALVNEVRYLSLPETEARKQTFLKFLIGEAEE